jgi:succinate-semialdehyde dehydrogenase/glutarate-semialdehyde dehydrogenase
MSLKSINPYSGSLIKETRELSDEQIEDILKRSLNAFSNWKKTGWNERRKLVSKTAELLRNNAHEYAGVITSEMGKPIRESLGEIKKCAWVCDYYSENAENFLKPAIIESDADTSYIVYEPLGPVLGIMPWNFPFWQVFRFVVPTLLAGNSCLLKHASNVQICAENIERIFRESGFPEDVFRNIAVGSARMENIIRHDAVKAVSLTGSESAGRKVASVAGDVLKKCVLELGGSNAFIVLKDADLDNAVKTGIQARYQNAGQSCIAAKRYIIDKEISERYISKFIEEIKRMKKGDPSNSETELGPLCDNRQAEMVDEQVRKSVAMGAVVEYGGWHEGAFFSPTVVRNVSPGMPLFDEEVFGPVTPFTIADDVDEAIRLAGTTMFGLGVSLFTKDISHAKELVSDFHDGSVFINGLVKSDPRLPFGGTRNSGYGRELSSQGIREFVNVKTVWIKNR